MLDILYYLVGNFLCACVFSGVAAPILILRYKRYRTARVNRRLCIPLLVPLLMSLWTEYCSHFPTVHHLNWEHYGLVALIVVFLAIWAYICATDKIVNFDRVLAFAFELIFVFCCHLTSCQTFAGACL